MITTIPFSGFYNSIHDEAMDRALEDLLRDHNGDENKGAAARAWQHVDFSVARDKYARKYAELFGDAVGAVLEFESMSSPREYNFETDRIFCNISEDEVRRLLSKADREALDKAAVERFTSQSGFISHYSPDVSEWGDVATWDHNQVGTLLEVLAESAGWDEITAYEWAVENGMLEDWICEGSGDEFNRIVRVVGYLNRRAERITQGG